MLRIPGLAPSLSHVFRPLFVVFDEAITEQLEEFGPVMYYPARAFGPLARDMRECLRSGITPVVVATDSQTHTLALRVHMNIGIPVLTQIQPKRGIALVGNWFYIPPRIVPHNSVPPQVLRFAARLGAYERIDELLKLILKVGPEKCHRHLEDLAEL